MEKLNVDCLILIFNKLKTKNKCLYSCLLVNKEWFHLVVPILWENPYLASNNSKEKFCNTILSCLPTSLKQLLFDNAIRLPSTILSKSLTLNYISLFKSLNFVIIGDIIEFVFKKEILLSIDFSAERKLLEQEIYKLLVFQCRNVKELVWLTCLPLQSFPGAQSCFSKLYRLDVNLIYVTSNNLYEMAQICKDLKVLRVDGYSEDSGLISLIDTQRNLKCVTLNSYITKGKFKELDRVLARKSCTINNLTLFNSAGVISHSFLTSLTNLNFLTISNISHNAKIEEIEEFKKYLVNSNFPHLYSLDFVNNLPCFKELAMLIEKTKGNISDVHVNISIDFDENTGMLLEAISNHCPNIKFLSTQICRSIDLIYFKSLLRNCRSLACLYLNSLNGINDIGDNLLDILTKFSPKSLTTIGISGDWEYSIDALKNFFESYRGRKLSFDINSYVGELTTTITSEHINVVRKYYDEKIVDNSNLLESYSFL